MPNRVMLTGHGGFVGHHCLHYFLEKTDWDLICIDSFRHKGTIRRVVEAVADDRRVKTYKHDLTVPLDRQLENLIFEKRLSKEAFAVDETPVDYIINMASDSAVERSVSDPTACMRNNYELMINMLEFARRANGLKAFIHISTDEVYGEAFGDYSHKEWDMILPSNPYAASKAAQEALAIAYWRTYNLPVVIVNIMNIIGERQDHEKFLPKIIEKVAKGEEMPIYGNMVDGFIMSIGTRCYLHARNVADALTFIANRKPRRYSEAMFSSNPNHYMPDKYHICGEAEVNNLDMAKMVAEIMGKELKYKMVSSESARPGYDRRYMLDGSKLKGLGWKQPMNFKESLERIVSWTMRNPHWLV